ncbi:MAG: hypothetical protein ABIH38_05780 [Patescibacteria group bacterium]
MIWLNFFHIYQPPDWEEKTIKKVARECYGPMLDILKRNPGAKIILNINAALTEQLAKYNLKYILDDITTLAKKGQIEFTHSAKYHLILPLFSEKIIARQIKLNEEVNRKLLGKVYQPKGFFAPEMAWGNNLIPVLEKLKVKWVILDEIAYDKKIGGVNFERGYKIKDSKIKIIFRNRTVSNFFAFEATYENPGEFFQKIKDDGRNSQILVTGMDGENLGHHRPNTEKLWEYLITRKNIKTVNSEELFQKYHDFEEVSLAASSWSSEVDDFSANITYILWQDPNNPIHQKQWQLVGLVLNLMTRAETNKDNNIDQAQKSLDKALASDQFWWASMRPWWSVDIIIRETKELGNVPQALKSLSITELKKVSELVEEIITLVHDWQNSGKARVRAEEYMRRVGFVPELGGKKITD